jgi:hypothetical protein
MEDRWNGAGGSTIAVTLLFYNMYPLLCITPMIVSIDSSDHA